MLALQNELKNVFKLELKIKNMLCVDLAMFVNNNTIFKIASNTNIEKIIKNKIEKDGIAFSHLYSILKSQKFADYNRSIDVTIAKNSECYVNGYAILLDTCLQQKIEQIHDKNTICAQKLGTVKEVQSYFEQKLIQIREAELRKIENEIEQICTDKPFYTRITQKQNNEMIGYLHFLVSKYDKAKLYFEKSGCCEEMIFYCNIMLETVYTGPFIYHSNDLVINLRRIYFVRQYLALVDSKSVIVYYTLNSFDYKYSLLKLILETELAVFLDNMHKFSNRRALALYNCTKIAYEQNLFDICSDYVEELKKTHMTRTKELQTYIEDIEALIAKKRKTDNIDAKTS